MVKFSSAIFLLWSLALVSLIGLMVDSKSHHVHHTPRSHLHPHSNSRHQRHYDLHHRKSSRNKRSESTVNPLTADNFINNNNNSNNKSIDINTDSDKKMMINSDKSLVDLEKLFGPIPHQLYDHIRVKRNNLKNNFGESSPLASSEYLKKLADSFAGPAAENDQDNFDELETNDRQLSFNSDDLLRKKRRADLDDDFEETNFFPDDSRLVNLIRTKRFGDPDKKTGRSAKGKRNVRNKKNIKQEHAGKGRDGFRLKRKSKITGNKRLKKENLNDKLSREKNKIKDKSKLKRCTKTSISKNDKNLNKKHDKVKSKVRRRRNSVGDSKALAPLEEIRDLAANLVSKVDELEGSIKINRRSGRNSHGYPSAISNSKRVHHLLGSRHSASDFSYSPDKFMIRPIMRMKRRKNNRSRIRKIKRKRKRKRMNDDNDIDNKIDTCKKPRGMKNKKWARWTDWSSCSVTCGKGRQIRWRHCRRNCKNAETEMEEKTCQLPACAPARLFGIF